MLFLVLCYCKCILLPKVSSGNELQHVVSGGEMIMEKQLSVPSCQLPARQREGWWQLLWVLAAGSRFCSA